MRTGLDCGRDLKSPEAIDWLADIALHLDSLDPIDIGAGAVLQSSGHARGNEQLSLLPGVGAPSSSGPRLVDQDAADLRPSAA